MNCSYIENESIERAKRGDRTAFDALVLMHSKHVFRVAVGILKDVDDAQDVVQEVWLTLFEQLPHFRGDAKLSTWLHRVTVNHCLMQRRRLERRARFEGPAYDAIEYPASTLPQDETVEFSRQMNRLTYAWAELPEAYRDVLHLRAVEGAQLHEIAVTLGLSLAATKSRIFRARGYLKTQMDMAI